MQNGNSSVNPAAKTPPPGLANWTPPEDNLKENSLPRAKKIYVNDNLSTIERVIICFGEFFGTAILVFLGCMGCVMSTNSLQISFTFGLAVMTSVQCFGHISGAHINPAVTIAAVVLGHTPIMQFPVFFVGQILGGIGGFGLLKALSADGILKGDNSTLGVCSPGPLGPGLSAWQGVCVEFALTFILVMVCAAVWDCRNSTKHDSLAIRLGLAVAVLAMAGGAYTGANMNPARSFGPALFNGDWDKWWIWWLGPMMGGLTAGLLYRFAFSRENEAVEHAAAEVLPLNDKP